MNHGMDEHDREALNRLLTVYGTLGVANELASICRQRAQEEGEEDCAPLWLEAADLFEAAG